jgi:hypothetical protein
MFRHRAGYEQTSSHENMPPGQVNLETGCWRYDRAYGRQFIGFGSESFHFPMIDHYTITEITCHAKNLIY